MELSEQAFVFAETILKHYTVVLDSTNIETVSKEEMEKMMAEQKQKAQPANKYDLDYSKWDNISEQDEAAKKKKEEAEMTKQYQNMFAGHDRRKERDLYEKSTKDKLDAAERFKNEGNNLISKGNYEGAIIEYDKALLQFHYTFPDTKEEEDRMEKLQEACHCNMALAKLNLKEYAEAIINCDQALKSNPKNRKASYRKAKAYLGTFNFEKAKLIVEGVLKDEPENKEFLDMKKLVESDENNHRQQEKNLYQKMLG